MSVCPGHSNNSFVGEGLALPDTIFESKHLKIFLMNLEQRIIKLNLWRIENEFNYQANIPGRF